MLRFVVELAHYQNFPPLVYFIFESNRSFLPGKSQERSCIMTNGVNAVSIMSWKLRKYVRVHRILLFTTSRNFDFSRYSLEMDDNSSADLHIRFFLFVKLRFYLLVVLYNVIKISSSRFLFPLLIMLLLCFEIFDKLSAKNVELCN